ncbi:hypothetical protein [Glutamicibacter sp. NPDC087673]|uniref:hypothetical protein n=1 Tax=Glutamicibacter sp. NPDC087673 TaxID=3363997 RepID=UPI00382CFAD5
MALTIGYVTYDEAVTSGTLYVQWQDALDLPDELLQEMLWAGYDAVQPMAPASMQVAPISEDDARKLFRAQVLLARSALARMRPSEQGGGDEFQLQDLSRRLWLEARTLLRPRRMKGIR